MDNDNQALPDDEQSEKQKRSRKRKSESDTVSTQAYQVATHLQPSELASNELSTLPVFSPNTVTTTSGEEANPDQAATQPAAPLSAVGQPGSGCGGQLKAAREALGLSIHDVCSQLRLGVHQIQAIEQDDFAKLPQKSIVRGFIRNYARLLKIDASPILLAYQQMIPAEAPANISVKSSAHTAVINGTDKPINLKNILILLLVCIGLGGITYFYIHHVQPVAMIETPAPLAVEPEAPVPDINTALPPALDTSPTPSTDNANAANLNVQPSETPVSSAATNTNASTANEGSTNPTTNSVPVENKVSPSLTNPAPVNAGTANTAAVAMPVDRYATTATTPTPAANTVAIATTLKATDPVKAQLTFTVTEESWVRIEDDQGKKVFSEVLSPGSPKLITVDKPLSIIVGHANATQLMIDNQPYDLSQATRGRVARVNLK